MPRTAVIIAGAIPVAVAILIAVPLLTLERVPATTLLPDDMIDIEHTMRRIATVPGVIERERALESHVLQIDASGSARLLVATVNGTSEHGAQLGDDTLQRARALIKETGFMSITPSSFVPDSLPAEYELHTLRVELNGDERTVRWSEHGPPDEDSPNSLAPPLILALREELGKIAGMLAP